MTRIVCIGNRLAAEDAAGPLVHDRLRGMDLPSGVEVVDGGVGGLDLLRCADGAGRLVFVDAVEGVLPNPGAAEVPLAPLLERSPGRFDHGAGLAYLLHALPIACGGTPPAVRLVGVEGPCEPSSIASATELALALAVGAEPLDQAGAGAGEARP